MKLDLEKLINNNKYLKETLEKSVEIRKEKAEKTKNLVEKSKQERKENIDKPFDAKKIKKGKFVYIPLRVLMEINTKLSGAKNIVLNKYKHIDDGKPIIYVPTHVCRYDIELVFETIKNHAHLLSGTEDRMLGSLEGSLLGLNGVNYVDRSDSVDRKLAMRKMNKDLENGVNLMIFPEGTWNLSENLLIQPISYSVVDLAIKNDASIELIAFDQEGKQIFTNFGGRLDIEDTRKILKPIYAQIKEIETVISNNNLNESDEKNLELKLQILEKYKKEHLIKATIKLRDSLATLKWETMVYKEEYLQTKIKPNAYTSKEYIRNNPDCDYNYFTKRENINETYWGDAIANMVKEWFMTDLLEESDYIFKPKGEAYEFFEEFNSREKNVNGEIIRERISSEGKQKRK